MSLTVCVFLFVEYLKKISRDKTPPGLSSFQVQTLLNRHCFWGSDPVCSDLLKFAFCSFSWQHILVICVLLESRNDCMGKEMWMNVPLP